MISRCMYNARKVFFISTHSLHGMRFTLQTLLYLVLLLNTIDDIAAVLNCDEDVPVRINKFTSVLKCARQFYPQFKDVCYSDDDKDEEEETSIERTLRQIEETQKKVDRDISGTWYFKVPSWVEIQVTDLYPEYTYEVYDVPEHMKPLCQYRV